jgi:hypothetical protein
MSQPNNPVISRYGEDEDEFPNDLEGVDWRAAGPIEGDEPESMAQTEVSIIHPGIM